MALFCGTVGGELENLCQAPNTGQLVAGIGRGKAEPSLSDANCVRGEVVGANYQFYVLIPS